MAVSREKFVIHWWSAYSRNPDDGIRAEEAKARVAFENSGLARDGYELKRRLLDDTIPPGAPEFPGVVWEARWKG